jgi:hypothetical protein
MSAINSELGQRKLEAEYASIMEAIRQTTPEVTVTLGVGETVTLIGVIQLALRHPLYRERPSAKGVENICRMLIDGLASRDERIRPMLEMGFDERFDQ